MARDRAPMEIEIEDAGRRVSEHSSGNRPCLKIPEGLKLFIPKKEGTYRIEIIPFPVGERALQFAKSYARPGKWYFERTFFTHARVGVNGDSYTCLAKTFNKPCPICEHRGRLVNSPRKEDEDLAAALKPKERQLFLVYDYATPDDGVKLWEISFHNFGKNLDKYINGADPEDRDAYRRFYDPKNGKTLKLTASEESAGTGKFLEFTVHEMKDRKEELDPDLFRHGICLDDVPILHKYDELKRVFLQVDEEEKPAKKPEADEDDAPPPKKKSAPPPDDDDAPPPPKKKSAPPPDDDDAPPPKKAPPKEETKPSGKFSEGDTVSFEYKEQEWNGRIVEINTDKEIAKIEVEGRDRPMMMDLDDLKLVKPKKKAPPPDEEEEAPVPKKKSAPPPDDDDPPPARKPQPKDDDDEPPAPKKKAPPPNDDEPPKKAPAKKGWDDDDDEPPAPKKKAPPPDDDDEPPRRKSK